MHFVSFIWIAWMAGTVALYWILPGHLRRWGLVATTLAFLLVHAPLSALLLLFSTLVTYWLTHGNRVSRARAWTLACVITAIPVFYKLRVGATSYEDVIGTALVPLGLSYYSFRCLHYLFDRYRNVTPAHGFGDLVCYLFFLPTLVVGPIHRFGAFVRDAHHNRWDAANLSEALERILYGYVKITVLGTYLMSRKIPELVSGIDPANQALILYLDIVCSGINLYFQFAGYSDIAIGFALLLGYRVIENFNFPYLCKNPSEFWRAWHISLSSWCRDYIYLPMIGFTRRPYLASFATFLVMGLWHEISLRFVVWALYQTIGLVAWREFQKLKREWRLPKLKEGLTRYVVNGLCMIATWHWIWFGFSIGRYPDLATSFANFTTVLLFWR